MACLVALASIGFGASACRAKESGDDAARATFLLLLGKYVTWPTAAFSSSSAPIVVAVVGNPSLVNELRTLSAGQQIQGRTFEIRQAADAAECAGAHIVFVSESTQSSALAASPPLRVLEDPAKLADTDIAIRMKEGRVAFFVNRRDVARRGIKLSSKLMRLASAAE